MAKGMFLKGSSLRKDNLILFENHRNRQLIKDLIPSAQHDSTIEFIMRKSFSDSVPYNRNLLLLNHSFNRFLVNADKSYLISATMKIQEDCQDCNWLHFYDIFNLIPLVSFLRIVLDRIEIEHINDMSHII